MTMMEKTNALWGELTDKVRALAEEFGSEKVNEVAKEVWAVGGKLHIKDEGKVNFKVDFQGTLDEIASLVDETEKALCAQKNTGFRWVSWSKDGSWKDESGKTFKTAKEAYDDMRNAALEKMKWNTEYDDDFDDCERIGYAVKFSEDTISHDSYSGTYFWHLFCDGYNLTDEDKKVLEEIMWR